MTGGIMLFLRGGGMFNIILWNPAVYVCMYI